MEIYRLLGNLFEGKVMKESQLAFNLFDMRLKRNDENLLFRMYCDVTYKTRIEIAEHLNVAVNTVNRWYTGNVRLSEEREQIIVEDLIRWEKKENDYKN